MNNEIKQNRPDDNRNPQNEDFLEDYGYPEGYEPQKTSRAAMIIAVIAAVVVSAAVAGFFVYLIFFNQSGEENKDKVSSAIETTVPPSTAATAPTMTANVAEELLIMPDLSGMKEREAYEALNRAGIKFKVKREYSDDVLTGYIISQSPWPNNEISKHKEALIYISKGVENEIHTTPRTRTESDTTEDASSPKHSGSDDDYLLPDSDKKILSVQDLAAFDRDTLNLALNEIFARHGYIFSDAELKAYFTKKSWYHGTVKAKDFDYGVFNSHEAFNIDLITSYQEQMGYR